MDRRLHAGLFCVSTEALANAERRSVTARATYSGSEVLFPLLPVTADPAVTPGRSLFRKE